MSEPMDLHVALAGQVEALKAELSSLRKAVGEAVKIRKAYLYDPDVDANALSSAIADLEEALTPHTPTANKGDAPVPVKEPAKECGTCGKYRDTCGWDSSGGPCKSWTPKSRAVCEWVIYKCGDCPYTGPMGIASGIGRICPKCGSDGEHNPVSVKGAP